MSLALNIHRLLSLFFPPCCPVCGSALQEGEDTLCTACKCRLPRTGYWQDQDPYIEQMFWGKVPVVRATAFLYYHKGSPYSRLVRLMKYGGRKDLGVAMGRLMGGELAACGFFSEVDALMPVPLHRRKQRKRGYNQSACLAQGVAQVTGLPVLDGCLCRVKDTGSQTHLTVAERWNNMSHVFRLDNPSAIRGKHIMLIDDVLTTGATLTACADALKQAEGTSVSMLALARADS